MDVVTVSGSDASVTINCSSLIKKSRKRKERRGDNRRAKIIDKILQTAPLCRGCFFVLKWL